MDGLDHDFDPDGDLILLLRARISMDPVTQGQSGFSQIERTEEPSIDEPTPIYAGADSDNYEVSPPLEEIAPEIAEDAVQDTPSVFGRMRVRVSSRHLGLASRTLKFLLPNGPEWALLDDDPGALLILLGVIHGRFWDVPHKVDLSTLTEIAILVDKYDLCEAVSVIKDRWFHNLERIYPDAFDEEILKWMCVSWVFDWREIWDAITVRAKMESDCLIMEEKLPIPKSALGKYFVLPFVSR